MARGDSITVVPVGKEVTPSRREGDGWAGGGRALLCMRGVFLVPGSGGRMISLPTAQTWRCPPRRRGGGDHMQVAPFLGQPIVEHTLVCDRVVDHQRGSQLAQRAATATSSTNDVAGRASDGPPLPLHSRPDAQGSQHGPLELPLAFRGYASRSLSKPSISGRSVTALGRKRHFVSTAIEGKLSGRVWARTRVAPRSNARATRARTASLA